MTNQELYCFSKELYARLEKENAPTTNRGIFGGAWRRPDCTHWMSTILTLHGKERKPFMGYNV